MGMTAADALGPVLADLAATGAPIPAIRISRSPDTGLWAVKLTARDGTGQGFTLDPSEPPEHLIARASDQVQEWMFDQLGRTAPTNWPPCPLHPEGHPLNAKAADGMAVWMCPSGAVIAEVGNLAATVPPGNEASESAG